MTGRGGSGVLVARGVGLGVMDGVTGVGGGVGAHAANRTTDSEKAIRASGSFLIAPPSMDLTLEGPRKFRVEAGTPR
jgi:uncharacterized membrane protein YfcA